MKMEASQLKLTLRIQLFYVVMEVMVLTKQDSVKEGNYGV